MRFSISITNYSWRGEPLRERLIAVAASADDSRLDTVWVPDHLLQVDPTVTAGDTDMLEAYSTLGFMIGQTRRVRFGSLVTNVTMRPPALLAQTISTLDALSGGRVWLGLGAGYRADEDAAMGLASPPTKVRFEQLDETVRIADQMWSGDTAPFNGQHFRLSQPVGDPRPKHRPKILIGGMGERRTLRLVAHYADACNLFDIPDDGQTIRHKLDVLHQHCDDLHRPFADIDKTVSTRLAPGESAADLARRCEVMAGWGVEHLIFVSSTPWVSTGDLATILETEPQIRDLTPSTQGAR